MARCLAGVVWPVPRVQDESVLRLWCVLEHVHVDGAVMGAETRGGGGICTRRIVRRVSAVASRGRCTVNDLVHSHYVPQLAARILDGQKDFEINMKGFLVGNPGIDNDW
jgi:hypothetical protein